MNAKFVRLTEEVEFLAAERRHLAAVGPHFRIVHRFSDPGTDCAPGEEVAWALLTQRFQDYQVRLSLSVLLLFDYLARNSRLPQSATQIVAGMKADTFYVRHGANVKTGAKQSRRFNRSAVKEYIKRIRRALQTTFLESGLNVDPFEVLVSEPTDSNQTLYRLKATVEWVHLP